MTCGISRISLASLMRASFHTRAVDPPAVDNDKYPLPSKLGHGVIPVQRVDG